ncbi:MAG: ATP-dependent DNA helicase RecG, partial [Cellulomonadaceae bacterium]|nr:ATP-dependent DNA helicase RecG [Cellulomonadaceae bacterium]
MTKTAVGRTIGADPMDRRISQVLGERTGKALAKLGLITVGDLLHHYPRRYADPGTITPISGLKLGEHVSFLAVVLHTQTRTMRSRAGFMLTAQVGDDQGGVCSLTFFAKKQGMLRYFESRLTPQTKAVFSGVVSEYRGHMQLTHPDFQLIGPAAGGAGASGAAAAGAGGFAGDGGGAVGQATARHTRAGQVSAAAVDDSAAVEEAMIDATRPIPIYPATAAMPTWRIQKAVRAVLDTLRPDDVPDPLPDSVRQAATLMTRYDALQGVHYPASRSDWVDARHRLRFEEAFVLQTALVQRRAQAALMPAAARLPRKDGTGLLEQFDARLPFTLTAGQTSVGQEIAADLARPHPMQRLLQGEVGSGKTVVALRAMLQVIDAGGQAALLAPTEVLAAQHARTLRAMLGDLAGGGLGGGLLGGGGGTTTVALLTGSLPTAARRQALLDAASGQAGIVVGTHALLSDVVQFADLGLVVVDEQHRFGVEQRDRLRDKSVVTPHLLVMTATPIPRTVAMTVFGDLEVSTLTEVPSGRAGITTHVVPAANPVWIDRVWQRIREEVDKGNRAYIVCPRITADDDTPPVEQPDPPRTPLRAVTEVADLLRSTPALSGISIDILHGQLRPDDKEAAMARFASGQTQVLVATTVIEVGVDVPEATVMVVLDAEFFGLSQLHQLRGRVGRGTQPGLCLLVTSAEPGSDGARRVEALAQTSDGFALAQ